MLISSSQFNSGNNKINLLKKQNTANYELQKTNYTEKTEGEKTYLNSEAILSSYNNKSGTYKSSLSYLKQNALDQYQVMENLEKIEFAKSALGFSAYA